MNALRIGWIVSRIHRHFPPPQRPPILDVGCGAGLAAEALARLEFPVLGIDPSAELIAVAEQHAAARGLPLSYRTALPEMLAAEPRRFAVITALEVIEHVADPPLFLSALATLLAPGGLLFLSTLNRTIRSFLLGKIGAEYVLRLLPPGTHNWRQFISPADLERMLAGSGLRLADIAGMTFDPLGGIWRESRDTSVNYILMALG